MLTTAQIDPELDKLFDDVFGDWRRARAEAPVEAVLDRRLWATLDELGLTRLTAKSGAEATWIEAAGLLRATARVAAPVPIAEHDLLAHWLLESADIDDADGIRTAALLDTDGNAGRVPWAAAADGIVGLWRSGNSWLVADLPAAAVTISPGFDLAGQPRDDIRADLTSVTGTPVDDGVATEYRLRGALARAVQMTGAMDRAVELCVQFATERRQFGRPIAKFQAVQQLIADAACESSLARAATDAAVATFASGTATADEIEIKVAIARSVTGHSASVIVRHAHQVHGAIGTTFEHSLHEFTKPILAWRSEFGSVRSWDTRLTELVLQSGQSAWAFGMPVGRHNLEEGA